MFESPNDQSEQSVTPSRDDIRTAEIFIKDLIANGGEEAAQSYCDYTIDCIEQRKVPMPRENVYYGEGEDRVSEAEIYETSVAAANFPVESNRRLFLTGMFSAALGVVVALAMPKVILDILDPLPPNPNQREIEERERKERALSVAGITVGLTAGGFIGAVMAAYAAKSLQVSDDPALQKFAVNIKQANEKMAESRDVLR